MSWLTLLIFGLVILGAGYLAGYATATLKLSRYKTMADAAADLENNFRLVAGEALQRNNQAFLDLATQNLSRFQSEAKGELDKKQQAFAEMVKPIGEALKRTEEQIREIEKDRKESFGSIASHLKLMAEGQQQLQAETRNLVTALRRPEVRGRWGEMVLKRVVELAGMIDRCDFVEQPKTDDEESRLRPDMVVHLAENRTLIVDAKTPLDSYLSAIEANSSADRDNHLASHARKVRERIKELAAKRYWNQFKSAPDFVIMFIPGDQYLTAALDKDPELQEQALRDKVLITTPTTLMGLLKIVAYGWRQIALAENAEQIRELGSALHQRLATFAEHMDKVGSSLNKSMQSYNDAVGSLERQVLPGARRFTELGVQAKKDMPVLEPIETAARLTDAKKPDA